MLDIIKRFGQQTNAILNADPGPKGLERVRALLERELLTDKSVYDAYLAADDTPLRNILYEDPELGFCIVAHKYPGPRQGRCHDHGPAWAIYGQVEGNIEMTEFEILEPPTGGNPGKVREVNAYTLEPGHARVFAKGQVHSPNFPVDVRVIRIEGKNLEGLPREQFERV